MKRRTVLRTLLAVAAIALPPFDVGAQRAADVVRIGYLSPHTASADAANRRAFVRALTALGYIEGKNALIEARYADGKPDALPTLAAELAAFTVDVVVAATTPAVRAAQLASSTTPVVMAFAGDPVGDGLVATLARPGGNTSGLSAAVTEIAAKRVEFLRAVVPTAAHFVLLAPPTASISMVSGSEDAGGRLGTRVTTLRVRNPSDIGRAFSGPGNARIDGVIVDLAIQPDVAQILALAGKQRLPTVSGPREFALAGGLLAYGADYPDLFRRAALYVDKILRGAKPGELPVEQPIKFSLIVNLKTAKALGLTIPQSLVLRADELIQ